MGQVECGGCETLAQDFCEAKYALPRDGLVITAGMPPNNEVPRFDDACSSTVRTADAYAMQVHPRLSSGSARGRNDKRYSTNRRISSCLTEKLSGIKYKSELETAMAVQSMTYGGVDGVITTFAVLAAGHAANMQFNNMIIIALATLLADAISMGYGDYISTRLMVRFIDNTSARLDSEFEKDPEPIKTELKELIQKGVSNGKGLSEADSDALVNLLAKDKAMFLNAKMALEMDMDPDTPSNMEMIVDASKTFFAFLAFGMIPLSIYLISLLVSDEDRNENVVFGISSVCTLIGLFCIGVVAALITRQKEDAFKNGLFVVSNGCACAGAAYLAGFLFEQMLH